MECTLYGKRLVDTHQVTHPILRKEVIADSNLTSSGKANIYEKLVEESRIEHNVAMVADKSIAVAGADIHRIYATS